jgi:hypothetical protein
MYCLLLLERIPSPAAGNKLVTGREMIAVDCCLGRLLPSLLRAAPAKEDAQADEGERAEGGADADAGCCARAEAAAAGAGAGVVTGVGAVCC